MKIFSSQGLCLAVIVTAGLSSSLSAQGADSTPPPTEPLQIDKRNFGVLPNYRSADAHAEYKPIETKKKLTIAAKDSFDKPIYFLGAFYAGISHLQNQNPSFGQGTAGFAQRYVRGFADQAMGNMFTEGLFPAMLKEDPRYFIVGPSYGGKMKRTGYALSRIFVTRTDAGKTRFNFSETLGNGSAVAISNTYYPDTRNVKDNTTKFATQLATDAFSNIIKEFWPDIKRKMEANKARKLQQKN